MNRTAFSAIDLDQIARKFELFAPDAVRAFILACIDMS